MVIKLVITKYSETVERETQIPRERYISPEERQKIIDELKLA